jgi:hypothetical protein
MSWVIASGPTEVRAGGYDGVLWQWRVRSDNGNEKNLLVGISGTALASRRLPEGTARAIASRGRSAVADVLDWPEPPDRIDFFTTDDQSFEGGDPPASAEDEAADLARVEEWFRERGLELNVHQVDDGWSAALMPLGANVGSGLYAVAGSRLEAARRVRERYLRSFAPA